MNILVTGGIGSIGRFTVAHLLAQGHQVRILDRESESDIKSDVVNFIKGAEYHQVDITDYAKLRVHFDGIDAIVHLAAIPYPVPGKDLEIFDINCGGTFNVYQAAADTGDPACRQRKFYQCLGEWLWRSPHPSAIFPNRRRPS